MARVPPQESAELVRALYDGLLATRRKEVDAEETLYLATFRASQDGWSDRALGRVIGVPYPTVQGWRERGQRLAEQG